MNKESFWIFGHTGMGDMIVCNSLYRHYANLHKDKIVILPIWNHNLAAIQWMLSDVPNIFFYPIETEAQMILCMDSQMNKDKLCLGFYGQNFEAIKWDSEFYRQAGLNPELKWSGFKLPRLLEDGKIYQLDHPFIVTHEDRDRGFIFKDFNKAKTSALNFWPLSKNLNLKESCIRLFYADEIHCIDSSMLNLADLMETPHCKRFVFHKYARRGLPPSLRKPWEIIE